MAIEIERKFLVRSNEYKRISTSALFRQGYLSVENDRIVRVRRYNDRGYLTIKGKTHSISREEYEYEIPVSDADRMLDNLCIKPIIEKVRYFYQYEGNEWIIDEFLGENEGLIVAEIELLDEQQMFQKPGFIGDEITGDIRFFNSNLIKNPFKNWKQD